MKKAILSNSKHQNECSNKHCICGGHNLNNPKKNKNHNSTKSKLNIKEKRKFSKWIDSVLEKYTVDELWEMLDKINSKQSLN